MATTTTNYVYDKSGRMTSMWSTDTADATYFTYNQRDMATKILRLPAGGDATRTFTYNAVGERVVVDESGGTTPNYWTYDGYKLLTEKDSAGAEVRRYRHNAMPNERFGANIEMHSGTFGTCAPVTDQGGALTNVLNVEGNDVSWTNIFGEVVASVNALKDRLKLPQELGTQALTTTLPFFVTPTGGVYFSRLGLSFGGIEKVRGALGLLLCSFLLDCNGRGVAAAMRTRTKRHGMQAGGGAGGGAPPPSSVEAEKYWITRGRELWEGIGGTWPKYCIPREIIVPKEGGLVDVGKTKAHPTGASMVVGPDAKGIGTMSYRFGWTVNYVWGSDPSLCRHFQYVKAQHTFTDRLNKDPKKDRYDGSSCVGKVPGVKVPEDDFYNDHPESKKGGPPNGPEGYEVDGRWIGADVYPKGVGGESGAEENFKPLDDGGSAIVDSPLVGLHDANFWIAQYDFWAHVEGTAGAPADRKFSLTMTWDGKNAKYNFDPDNGDRLK